MKVQGAQTPLGMRRWVLAAPRQEQSLVWDTCVSSRNPRGGLLATGLSLTRPSCLVAGIRRVFLERC